MKPPLKVLVLDTGKEWGGGTNSLFELLKRIDRQRFAVTACFYHDYPKADSSLSRELASLNIPLILLPARHQPLWAKLGKELARGLLCWHKGWRKAAIFTIDRHWRIWPRVEQITQVIRDGGFQLLYVNNQPSSNLEAYWAADALGLPLVQHCRIETTLNQTEITAVNRVAHTVICVSHGVAESLARQGVSPERLTVVCNAIDGRQSLPEPQVLPGIPPEADVIGTVGSLIKRKAVDHLLHAVASLTDVRPHVLIVGDGPESGPLHQLAEELGLSERVHFVGFQKAPLSWMAAMDVVVLSSEKEGLPRVVLEAMLLAKPVIASRVVGSRELVTVGETGYLYDYADIQALTECLRRLLNDPAKRQQFGAAGRQRVLQDYSIERYVSEVASVLAAAGEAG